MLHGQRDVLRYGALLSGSQLSTGGVCGTGGTRRPLCCTLGCTGYCW